MDSATAEAGSSARTGLEEPQPKGSGRRPRAHMRGRDLRAGNQEARAQGGKEGRP